MIELMLGVVVFYGLMHAIEFFAIHAKLGGSLSGNNALAFSLYNTSVTVMRFAHMLMMPMLGLIVDSTVQSEHYLLMVLACLSIAFISLIMIFNVRRLCVNFYCLVIRSMMQGKSLSRAFIATFFDKKIFEVSSDYLSKIKIEKIDLRLFGLSVLIYSIQSLSILLVYFYAMLNTEDRVFIVQFSTLINAFTTMLLVMKVDPELSVAIERNDAIVNKFYSIYFGRGLALVLVSPIIVLFFYFFNVG